MTVIALTGPTDSDTALRACPGRVPDRNAAGIRERGDGGVTSLLAYDLDVLDLMIAHASRDFR